MSLPYYEMHGQAGQPLVLLPGFATDLASWIFQREELARRHRLLLLDPRGVGRSPGPPFPTTTRAMAEEVLKVMDAAGLSQADVLGHSLGGAVAQELALLAPERVRRLLLVSTFALGSALPAELLRSWRQALRPIDEAAMTTRILPWLYSDAYLRVPNRIKSIVGFLRANRFPPSDEGLAAQISAVEAHDTRDRLAEISAPTLVVVGQLDRVTPPRMAQEVSRTIPGARYLEIPEAGHVLMIERPEAFTKAVLDFLR